MQLTDVRDEFPILDQQINGSPLVYLDSAASSLKPKAVVDRICQHYLMEASNVHRGLHTLSDQATAEYEKSRSTLRHFLKAALDEEIIFTRSATEALNLIAASCGEAFLKEGDEILLTEMEHHSNIVPWQVVAQKKHCHLKFLKVDEYGCLNVAQVQQLLNAKTKIFALTLVSNTLGTENPIEQMVDLAHQVGAKVVIDAAQGLAHTPIDVQQLGCDFLVGSAHKIFGPTGIGFLFGKKEWLEQMPPYQYGGGMIDKVGRENTTYTDLPQKFEAGTPHIAGAIGFAKALQFFQSFTPSLVEEHERELLKVLTKGITDIKSARLIGEPEIKGFKRKSLVSFVVQGCHHQDLGQLLNNYGVAVRTGHHCTQLLMKRFEIEGTVRVSVSIYNTLEDIQRFLEALEKSIDLLLSS